MGTCVETTIQAGGARRDRTADLLHAMQALSQLSYGPNSERRENLPDGSRLVKELTSRYRRLDVRSNSSTGRSSGDRASTGRTSTDRRELTLTGTDK